MLSVFTVNDFGDTVDANPGDGIAQDALGKTTLRAAVMEANASSGDDTIILPAGTYGLSIPGADEDAAATGDLDVTANLTILGDGAGTTIIDAGHVDRVLHVPYSSSAATLTLDSLTITGGGAAGQSLSGGGIYDDSGTLTVTNSTISGNSANEGGGVYAGWATVTITNSTISGNSASLNGGGIYSSWATLTLTNSTLSGNSTDEGGGIYGEGGTVKVTNSTLSGNSAAYDGGAIYADWATVTVSNSTLSGNAASYDGGGIYSDWATVTVTGSTLSGNSSPNGGGICNFLLADRAGTMKTINTIIAGNTGSVNPDVDGPFTSLGNNLIGNVGTATGYTDGVSGDLVGGSGNPVIDPRLGPLQNNGGPTLTRALLSDSPAIDAGNNAGVPATDQRGQPRILDGDSDGTAVVDIGAYEAAGHGATISGTASGALTEDAATNVTGGTLTVTDPDPGESVFQSPPSLVGTYGDFTFNATTGVWNYTLDNSKTATNALTAGQVADDTLTVTSQDGSASKAIVVTITGANDAPVAVADAASTTENAAVSKDVIGNDTDPDSPDLLSLVADSASIVSATLDADGLAITLFTAGVSQSGDMIHFDPGTDFDFLAAGETATVVIGYTVTDDAASPLTDDGALTVTVTGTNDAPAVSGAIASTAGEDDAAYDVDLLAGASDPDASDVLSVAGLTLVDGSDVGVTASGNSLSIDPAAYSSLAAGQQEVIRYSYTVDDGNGGSAAQTATITINGLNDAPTALALSKTRVSENQPIGTVVGTFTTTDPDAGDSHTYSLVDSGSFPDNAAFVLDGGQLQTAASFNFESQPSYTIRVQTDDTGGGTYAETFIITVTDVNESPTGLGLSNSSVAENRPIGTLVGTLTSIDPDAADSHTYSLVGGAGSEDNGSFTIDGDGLKTAAVFDYETRDSYSVRVRTTDAGGLWHEESFTISITDANAQAVFQGNDHFDDTFVYTEGDGLCVVEFNGNTTTYLPGEVGEIVFYGAGGSDTVVFNGFDQNETARLWPDHAEFTGSVTVTVSEVETITANMGGGDDRVEMYGTDGATAAEQLSARPHNAQFTGPGLNLSAAGFEALEVHAGAGPQDTAYLYDSADNDLFSADPLAATMSGLGADVFDVTTFGFPTVLGYASDGFDTADLHGSDGDDTFLLSKGVVKLYAEPSMSYYFRAKGFEAVTGYAGSGSGSIGDVAYMLDSSGNDEFTASPSQGTMEINVHTVSGARAVDMTVSAEGFDSVQGYSRYGGTDTATLTDSPGDDFLIARSQQTVLYNDTDPANLFHLRAKWFERVYAESTQGHDVAYMFDSPGRDVYTGTPDYSEIYGLDDNYDNKATSFAEVYAVANAGGNDIAYLFDAAGSEDHLEAAKPALNASHWAEVYNDSLDYLYWIRGFEQAQASYHSSDGDDLSGIDPVTADWLFMNDMDSP